MNSLIRRRPTVAALMYSVAALAIVVASDAAFGASTNPTVTVVNTTANPVPVSGSITVGNSVVPVEVRNADPVPVSISGSVAVTNSRLYGRWFNDNVTAPSPIIAQVPAGKRYVITDVIASIRLSGTSGIQSPDINFYNECAGASSVHIAGWYLPDLQMTGLVFKTSEHFSTGIVLSQGTCLKVDIGAPGVPAEVMLVWYIEDAT